MASDLIDEPVTTEELVAAVANLQRALEQVQHTLDLVQQQNALLIQALLLVIRGHWDAAQFGAQSVESVLVALNPTLHGKVNAVPYGNPYQP